MKIIQKPSPNYTPGRTHKIDRIVCHWIVGNLASADATFANPASKVSAHYGIEDGKVHQYVQEHDTAWHAGNGAMNARSIGIEHSAQPGRDATPSTIESSAQLLAEISQRHGIPLNRTTVIKHSEVVATQCPGTIPIDAIIARANDILKGEEMVTENQLSVLYRFYLGTGISEYGRKNRLGKQTFDQAQTEIIASDEYKAILEKAKAGLVPLKNLPEAVREVFGQK